MFLSDLKYTFGCGQHLFFICFKMFLPIYTGVPGGMCQTSGGCSLC